MKGIVIYQQHLEKGPIKNKPSGFNEVTITTCFFSSLAIVIRFAIEIVIRDLVIVFLKKIKALDLLVNQRMFFNSSNYLKVLSKNKAKSFNSFLFSDE